MNAHELARQLLKLPADTPVVMAQEDQPLGDYGVTEVTVERMRLDGFWNTDREVWESHSDYQSAGSRPPNPMVDVAYLDFSEPVRQVVDGDDGDVVQPSAAVTRPAVEAPIDAQVREHARAIEGYDRDTRVLQCADDARDELDRVGVQALLYSSRRCVTCGNVNDSDDRPFCHACWAVIQGSTR